MVQWKIWLPVAIAIVAVYVSYTYLQDGAGGEIKIPFVTDGQNCVGSECEGNPAGGAPEVPENQPEGTNSMPTSGPAEGSGGGSSYTPPPVELIPFNPQGQLCSQQLVSYCDEWEHTLYDPDQLPYGMTFVELYPECQEEEYFALYGQPTAEDCQNLYFNETQ